MSELQQYVDTSELGELALLDAVPSPYSEDPQNIPLVIGNSVAHVALVRQRIQRADDEQLFRLLYRVNELLKVLPEIPMTTLQRENANALAIGFKSLFAVRRT